MVLPDKVRGCVGVGPVHVVPAGCRGWARRPLGWSIHQHPAACLVRVRGRRFASVALLLAPTRVTYVLTRAERHTQPALPPPLSTSPFPPSPSRTAPAAQPGHVRGVHQAAAAGA